MIGKGFCGLCGRRFTADPHLENNGTNHTDCLNKLAQSESMTTGKLKLDLNQYTCIDCGTNYQSKYEYAMPDGPALCNGQTIKLCPWCRPDSEPNHYGR